MPEPVIRAKNHQRRALLLDFDGTLADTLPGLRRVYDTFLHSIDAVEKAPSFASVNGANLFQLIQELCRQHAPDRDAVGAWETYWQSVEAAVLESAPADGAHRLVAWARQQGWVVGIGSASRTDLIKSWLTRHALAPEIDCVIGADLCKRGKPDPAIYQLLVATLGVDKRNCIVIEDSDNGVASASGAGLDVIRLTTDRLTTGRLTTGRLTTGRPVDDHAAVCHHATALVTALDYLQQRFAPTRTL